MVVLLSAWAQNEASSKGATDHLIGLQQSDGTFRFDAREQHFEGLYSILGLAILSDRGWCPAVEKLVNHYLSIQGADGRPGAKTYKALFEEGYIGCFLAEVALQDKHGKIKLPGDLRSRLKDAIAKMVPYFEKSQAASGIWEYRGGQLNGYKETAVALGVLQFYRMAEALGVPSPQASIDRALQFMRSRWKDGGFVNGDLEKESSIHLTPACMASLLWIKGKSVSDMVKAGHAFNEKREQSGYLTQWKHDEYDRIPQNLQGQAKQLVERRQMFGLFHLCLTYLRERNPKFEKIHKQACSLLLANPSGSNTWNSTIGTGGATAFAVLTFNLAKKDSLVFFWPDPAKAGGGGGAAGAWLGAQLAKAADKGVEVVKTTANTTASGLKLKAKDMLLSLNGTAVADPEAVGAIMSGLAVGDELAAKILRDGKEIEAKTKVKTMPSAVARWKEEQLKGWW